MFSLFKKTPYSFFVTLAMCVFFSFGITLKNAYSVSAVLLLLIGLFYFFARKGKYCSTTAEDAWLYGTFLLYALVAITLAIFHDDSLNTLDKPSRYIAILPILYLLIRVPFSIQPLLYSLALGGIILGINTLYHLVIYGTSERLEGFTNAIQYGNIAILISMFCLASLAHIRKHRTLLFFLLLIATIAAFATSIASGSRGGWLIALSSPIIIFAWFLASNMSFKKIGIGFAILVGASILLYKIPSTGIQQRVDEAIIQVQQYQPNSKRANTSVGIRLELWRLNWLAITEHPILGWGQKGYQQKMQAFIDTKQTMTPVTRFTHPHNDFFNETTKKGLVGTIALLLMYGVPLTLFCRRYSSRNNTVRLYALFGIITVVSYIVFGLTQAFLAHNNGVMYYLLCIAFFWGGLRHEENRVKP